MDALGDGATLHGMLKGAEMFADWIEGRHEYYAKIWRQRGFGNTDPRGGTRSAKHIEMHALREELGKCRAAIRDHNETMRELRREHDSWVRLNDPDGTRRGTFPDIYARMVERAATEYFHNLVQLA
jgi:hypothetical protein